jgi:hypothetical protein
LVLVNNSWLIGYFIVLSAIFSYIMAPSFSGGKSQNTGENGDYQVYKEAIAVGIVW